jgi:hypothetical protein
MDGSCCPWA